MPGLGKIRSAVVCAIREGGKEKGGDLCTTNKINDNENENENCHSDGILHFKKNGMFFSEGTEKLLHDIEKGFTFASQFRKRGL